MRAGTARATMKVPATHASPPETIEKRTLVSDATSPASTLPRAGVAATWANSIPETRPRRWSGVTVQRIVPRRTGLTVARGPAGREHQQREPERLIREAEGRDRDAPHRRGDRHHQALSTDMPDPA